MLCTLYTPYLFQDDSLSVEPVGHCAVCCILEGTTKPVESAVWPPSSWSPDGHCRTPAACHPWDPAPSAGHWTGDCKWIAEGERAESTRRKTLHNTVNRQFHHWMLLLSLKQTSNNYITSSTTATTWYISTKSTQSQLYHRGPFCHQWLLECPWTMQL